MEDQQIVELLFARDERALAEIEKKYSRYCRAISMNILESEPDAEECVNDAYLQTWNSIPPNKPNSLSGYLGKLIRNISINRFTYNNAQKRNNRFDVLLSELEECLSDTDAEAAFEEGALAPVLDAFLESLPKEARMVFVRRYWYSDSIEELAEMFGMSVSKIKSLLFRTRGKLRQVLEKEHIEV